MSALAGFLLIFALSAPVIAAPRLSRRVQPQTDWLNLYDLSSYKEEWTATARVPDLAKDLPIILAEFKSRGAKLSSPLESLAASKIAHTQQLSYRLSEAQAREALEAVKKSGFPVIGLRQGAAPGNAPLPEISTKIQALMSERAANRPTLAKMPAVSALVDQVLDRLVMVKEVQERAQAVVILNITVSGQK